MVITLSLHLTHADRPRESSQEEYRNGAHMTYERGVITGSTVHLVQLRETRECLATRVEIPTKHLLGAGRLRPS